MAAGGGDLHNDPMGDSNQDRDRDTEGRARNARPRDGTGRPLPRGAAGTPRPPDDLVLASSDVLTPSDALDEAQRLLDADLPFQAHEVLEGAWKATVGDERRLWQGLAQLAVGLTHAQRGNAVGAAALLHRGAEGIARFETDRPYGVDVAGLTRYATELAARIKAGGVGELADTDRRPRLLGESVDGGTD